MIDTLEFARRMIDAGMEERTARALAHELRDGLPAGDPATKTDLAGLKAELKTDLADLRGDLKADIASARSSTIIWVAVFVGLGQVLPTLLQFFKGIHP